MSSYGDLKGSPSTGAAAFGALGTGEEMAVRAAAGLFLIAGLFFTQILAEGFFLALVLSWKVRAKSWEARLQSLRFLEDMWPQQNLFFQVT